MSGTYPREAALPCPANTGPNGLWGNYLTFADASFDLASAPSCSAQPKGTEMAFAGMTGDPAKMHVAAGQVDAAAQVINGLRQQIRSHHAALAGGWKSAAASAYQSVANDWDNRLGIILNNLELIHQKLDANHVQYQANEQDVLLAGNKIHQLLNQ